MIQDLKSFQGYTILKVLGETQLGATFLTEGKPGEKMVLKVFKGEVFARDQGFSYLMEPRQAITQGKLSNEAHLSFYRSVSTGDVPGAGIRAYLVRDYIQGENLRQWLKSSKSRKEINRVVHRISQALFHLHRAGLVHGGLCPENVIISHNSLKVTDFGTGRNSLLPLVGGREFHASEVSYAPPWHKDPVKLKSPATDIFSLGGIYFFLNKGAWPAGIPEDASWAVKKALQGNFQDLREFIQAIQKEEEPEKEEGHREHKREKGQQEQAETGQGATGNEDERAPESIPWEIQGKDLIQEPSALAYRWEKSLKNKADISFTFINLASHELIVRPRIVKGAEWIQIEPGEARVQPGEQDFRIRLGPVDAPGLRQGQIVLEIPLGESGACITREISIKADFKKNPALEALQAALRVVLMAFKKIGRAVPVALGLIRTRWKWVGLFLIVSPALIFHQQIVEVTSPYVRTTIHKWEAWVAQTEPTEKESSLANQPARQDIPAQLKRIKEDLLFRGRYLQAREKLMSLQAVHPRNEEVAHLLDQLRTGLTFQAELILPPGQQTSQKDIAVLPSQSGFRVGFEVNDLCYLYVYQYDSHNDFYLLFPNPEATGKQNPLQPERKYIIPEGEDWFILDGDSGEETLYFLASRWPARDLEGLYAKLKNASEGKKDTYLSKLLKRIGAGKRARANGLAGCVYEEYTFLHE